jgi:anti-anti-sigma factor
MAGDAVGPARDTDTHVILLSGELDIAALPDLTRMLTEATDVERPTVVVVDLSQVTFMDCAALRPLLDAHDRLDGRFRLHNPSPPVRRLLSRLDLSSLAT